MKRIQRKKKIKDTILILTNGKQTEKNYFNNLTSNFKSMFTIKVKFYGKQCDELVEYASKLNKDEYNQIWCVFDIDDTFKEGHLIGALKLAKQHNIKIAYSNEAFEVWLLYHIIENVKVNLTRKTYIREINNILKKDEQCSYKKNDEELLKSKFIPNTLIATQRAKKYHQKLVAEHQKTYSGNTNYRIWEWQSDTTVYKLIEALNLSLKDKNNT